MRLPALKFQDKYKTQIVSTLGINKTRNYSEGELSDGYGLSSDEFPALSQRKTWSYDRYEIDSVQSIYEVDGKLVSVKNNKLYMDNEFILDFAHYGSISTGPKTFAVVGTKLVIFPNKIYYDTEKKEHGALYGSHDRSIAVSKFMSRAITVGNNFEEVSTGNDFTLTLSDGASNVLLYAFEGNGAVRDCYDDENGQWDNYKLSIRQRLCGTTTMTFDGLTNGGFPMIKAGDFIIPKRNFIVSYGIETGSYGDDGTILPDVANYVQTTNFGRVEEVEHPVFRYSSSTQANIYGKRTTSANVIGHLSNTDVFEIFGSLFVQDENVTWLAIKAGDLDGYVIYDQTKMTQAGTCPLGSVELIVSFYSFSLHDTFLNHLFEVGEALDVSGSLYGINDASEAIVESIDVEKNEMTFTATDAGGKVFNAPTLYTEANGIEAGSYALEFDGDSFAVFDATESVDEDVVIFVDQHKTYTYIYGLTSAKIIGRYPNRELGVAATTLQVNEWDDGSLVSIARSVPNLDFICSSGNRLWGVSNKNKTIYVSALGNPEDFYGHMAQADGAWQLAVASDDDFTAIAPYSGNVIVFKEEQIIKVLGTNPSDFYTNEYSVPGVKKGCHKSIVTINNMLYYQGTNNVYAYNGYEPSAIGTKLGPDDFRRGVACTDNKYYYLHLMKPDFTHLFYGYDLRHGLWVPFDKAGADDLTVVNGIIYRLSNGTVYKQDGNGPDDTWMAEYCPFTDGTTMHKGLTKLLLYMDVEQGTTYHVDIKQDNGDWKRVHNGYATYKLTQCIPIRIGRCVRYAIRISGKGKAMLHEIKREVSVGSER